MKSSKLTLKKEALSDLAPTDLALVVAAEGPTQICLFYTYVCGQVVIGRSIVC